MSALTAAKAATAGRGWAYVGAVLGGAASIAANIAHSFIAPAGAPADWHPMAGKVVESILWPVILFVAVEILSRVAWPKGFWYGALRFGGMTPVATVAAIVSYEHASALLASYGESAVVWRMGPIAIDGLMLMSTAALIATGRRRLALAETAPAPAMVYPAPAMPAPVAAPAPAPVAWEPPADPYAYVPPAQTAATMNATAAPVVEAPATADEKPRPAAETRARYEAMKAKDKLVTQQQAADALGISRRTLRSALEATAPVATVAAPVATVDAPESTRAKPSMDQTRQFYLDLKALDDNVTQAQAAEKLGVSRVEMRDALAAASEADAA